jgi:probable rRNA maturation factor
MNLSLDVEDDAWHALAGLEDLAQASIGAALAAAGFQDDECDVAVLFTDDVSMAAINAEWRGKDRPTNVLSFPAPRDIPVPVGEARPLGDIVLAYGVIAREAEEQGKTLRAHVGHLMVHGTLHLLGYDHETDLEAEEMEALETSILKGLGITDPYE